MLPPRARSGGGPTLLECTTYRHHGHSKSDQREYRTPEEEAYWDERDPIRRSAQRLLEGGRLTPEALAAMDAEVLAEIGAAVAFAEASPPLGPSLAKTGVFAT